MSCDHNEENVGYVGLTALWANTFDIVYGFEANKSFCKDFLINYMKGQNCSSQAFLSKLF